jgi:hypothetical protein
LSKGVARPFSTHARPAMLMPAPDE